tara:strand:- start:274 stop:453 length:180 start_codon:yes stop_codon:yes gene_type:complete
MISISAKKGFMVDSLNKAYEEGLRDTEQMKVYAKNHYLLTNDKPLDFHSREEVFKSYFN